VGGETLAAVLERGSVPGRKLREVAAQIGDGMAAAHAARITHRDLKPRNIMVVGTRADGKRLYGVLPASDGEVFFGLLPRPDVVLSWYTPPKAGPYFDARAGVRTIPPGLRLATNGGLLVGAPFGPAGEKYRPLAAPLVRPVRGCAT
jgi:serine/threonine protein kinase